MTALLEPPRTAAPPPTWNDESDGDEPKRCYFNGCDETEGLERVEIWEGDRLLMAFLVCEEHGQELLREVYRTKGMP